MKPAGRIALAAATATTLVSGTAAAFAAAHPDTEQVAKVQADPNAHAKDALARRLDRLHATATRLERELARAGKGLDVAQRALLQARADAARRAAAAAAVLAEPTPGTQAQPSHQSDDSTPAPAVTPPEPHATSGASGSNGNDDNESDDHSEDGNDD